MSVAEIIQRRFKNKIKVKQLSSKTDIDKYVIKPPDLNRIEEEEIGLVALEEDKRGLRISETDQMKQWHDVGRIVRALKHSSDSMAKSIVSLAQKAIQNIRQRAAKHFPALVNRNDSHPSRESTSSELGALSRSSSMILGSIHASTP